MKILHTADVHLRKDDRRTVEALEEVLDEAERNEVDLLTIGGDLFHTPEDAEALRPELRELFDGNSFDILAIPGNHDEEVYREDLRFGNDLRILTDDPFETVEFDEVEVTGVPFRSSMDDELFSALKNKGGDKPQILLLHCTLDIGFRSGSAGEEGDYFPVNTSTLSELGFDYVLAGHIHSRVREVPLENGGKFIYPGSPSSHSSSETGKRHAVQIDTDEEELSTVPLETFYHDSYSECIRPGDEEKALNRIREWVAKRKQDNCELDIEVEGFIDMEEDEFYDELESAADPVKPDDRTRSVSEVLNHPLYDRFEEKINEREELKDEEAIRNRVIEVLSRLMTQNRVQSS